MLFFQDLKIAARSLARVRALWITVSITLALGIGANAAVFTLVRGVLLKPLTNRDEDSLLYVRQSAQGIGRDNALFSIPEINDIGSGLKNIKEIGTFSTMDFIMVGLGEPRSIRGGIVDGNYFDVMGLSPLMGRLFTPKDDNANAAGVAVLTYRYWVSGLHSDPEVLGKVIRLDNRFGSRSATIVGVLEPSVPYPVETEVFTNIVTSPHHLSATMVTGREHRMTEVFARLAPGADLNSAQAELSTAYSAMVASHPKEYNRASHFQINVIRLHDQINSRARIILWVLLAASGLLFVIACSNVANLILARTVRRGSELAIRTALGASRATLRRTLLAEGLVLCGSGALAGVLLAAPMVSVLARYASRFSVRAVDLTLDFNMVGIGAALALVAAVFLAYVPRLPSADSSSGLSLSSSSTRISGGNSRPLRVFAVTQIIASFLLLAGAAMLLRTLLMLERTQPPFETGHILAVNLPSMPYGKTPEQVREFYREVRRRVSVLPGVEQVSTGFSVPWRDGRGISFNFTVEGAKRDDGQDDPRARFRSVSPGFFKTLGVPILVGRDFNESDRDGAERVVIISKSIADKLFSGQDAVNRHLQWTDGVMKFTGLNIGPWRIIGVVPDLDDENIIPAPSMTVYQPSDQEGWTGRLFVRTKNDPYTLVPIITRTVRQVAAEQPVERAITLDDVRATVMTSDRLNAIVFGGFATLALLISVVGIAGVLAFSVSARTREFGIRMALGAEPRSILTKILLEGLAIASIGIAMGGLLSFALERVINQYIGLQRPGVLPLIISAFVILIAAIIAAALPAFRAARVNTVQALRSE